MDKTIELLKNLTEAHGISGYETPAQELVGEYLKPLGDLSKDGLGSLICRKAGSSEKPRVMLAGHVDEIGFMVKAITKDGFIKFLQIGGWFDQVLLGQRVIIKTRKGDLVGVIGAKPPHLLSPEERLKVVEKKDMYIDIGVSSLEEVEAAGVRVGDPVVPRADFLELSNKKTYLSKAFDDRVGVALVISTLQILQTINHPNTVYGVSTVMEEVGLRGATTSAEIVNPDVAIVLEADIARDIPGLNPDEATVKLGKGPGMGLFDVRMIPNLKLRDLVMDTAQDLGIPLQFSTMEGGATDGGAIHIHNGGVPTVVLTVPARHIHSHSAIIHRDDYDAAVKLLVELVQRLDADVVAGLTK